MPASSSAFRTPSCSRSSRRARISGSRRSDSPDPVRVGQDLTYTLTIQNAGPNAAAAVQVADTLPADATFKSVATSKGSCAGTTAITCDLGTVGNNATETVTIVVTPTKVGTLSNTATVSTASADANLANNTSTTTTTVTAQSTDLSIVKTDAPDPVSVGGDITYTLAVTNNGPDAATGVTATDILPAGVTFKSASAGCVNAAGTVTCTIGGLASGASTSVTITVTTTASGTISNTATVSGAETDPVSTNNSSTTSTTVNPLAQSTDLSIVKTDAPDPVSVGGDITYTLAVTNNGPDAATGVTATDILPAGVTFKSASAGCVNAAGTVTCTIGGLASGASTSVTITVTTTASGTISNTATVSGAETDPVSTNNSSTTSTTVNPLAQSTDLSIVKTDAPDPVSVGGDITYTLAVTNNGPDAATGVTATDILPAGVTFKSASAGCVNAAGTVTCTIGGLASGASTSVTITVTTTASGTISNTATVSGAETDPVSTNNSSTTSTTVNPLAQSTDLSIVKTDAPDPVSVGGDITYTLAVTNNGPDAATGVTATDILPAGVTFKSASAGCVNAAGTVTCTIGGLASGASTSVTITVTTTASGTISNTATVSGAETDPVSTNNSSTTSTTVNPLAQSTDLSIVKTDAPDPVSVGGDITYTLAVTNNGPDAATGVTATDILPAGVTFKSASAGCVNAAGTVTCTIGGLASGASTSVTITVTTTASGTISNTATVSGAETDPVSTNNSSTTSTTVNPLAQSTLTLSKVVDNSFGGTALATAWTLRAVGPTTVSGHTGDAAVTDAAVDPGTYTLSESGGPTGYFADPWSCTGGSLAGDRLTLTAGQSATCSITNHFVPYLAKGSFVIGDENIKLGATVTYWSPSWSMANTVSGETAPASFKGFAAMLSSAPPVVGGTWTTGPGASSDPPKNVPSYMAVIVASSVSQSGSTISGDITGIVVIKTGPTNGVGTIVAVLAP